MAYVLSGVRRNRRFGTARPAVQGRERGGDRGALVASDSRGSNLASIEAARGRAEPPSERLTMAVRHWRPGEVACLNSLDDVATRTVALARTPAFEAVHLVVRAGHSIPTHSVAGPITLYCIAGHVRFAGGSPSELRAGDWLYLDPGMPHAVEAVADSSLLLTILFDKSGEK